MYFSLLGKNPMQKGTFPPHLSTPSVVTAIYSVSKLGSFRFAEIPGMKALGFSLFLLYEKNMRALKSRVILLARKSRVM